jgi:hypothetical protein
MPGDSPLPQRRFAIGEAAKILRISRVTLYQRINAGCERLTDRRSLRYVSFQIVTRHCHLTK